VHEKLMICLFRLVANRAHIPLEEEKLKLSSEQIEHLVTLTYNQFCSLEALWMATANSTPGHKNFLLQLQYFATVVEANRAMKAGDHGRLMFMWKRWAIMAQGLGKLSHYSKHLPRLIVLLEHVLPDSLSRLVLNTLLISPAGKTGHFVATDFYLEVQNYWLKYFFNHSGIGTEINRLKDVFSSNIPVVSGHAALCCRLGSSE